MSGRPAQALTATPARDVELDGVCARPGVDPELFFSRDPDDRAIAKWICRQCPVRDTCLEYAMQNLHLTGIWGGLTRVQRRALQRQREAAPKGDLPIVERISATR